MQGAARADAEGELGMTCYCMGPPGNCPCIRAARGNWPTVPDEVYLGNDGPAERPVPFITLIDEFDLDPKKTVG